MGTDRRKRYQKRDRLRQLQAFCHAAELGSMTRAAERLLISQPAVSLHVRELEHELQVVLFERHGPRIALSPAGERFHELVAPLVEGVDGLTRELARELDQPASAELRVASGEAGAHYVLPGVFRRLRQDFPGIRIRLDPCSPGEGLDRLLAEEVELYFGARTPASAEFEYRHVFHYDLVLVTPRGHPLAGRESVTGEEIAGFPVIVPHYASFAAQSADSPYRHLGIEADVAIEAGGWDIVNEYVEADLGIALCPSFCLTNRRRVSVVPLEPSFRKRSYGWFMRREKPLSWSARRLVEAMDAEAPGRPYDGSPPRARMTGPENRGSSGSGGRTGRIMAGDEKRPHPGRDRVKQLRAFCHAARFQGISRAAERIFSSQPAVSQQVRTLEEDLAVDLFARNGPRIALTPVGTRLYRLASPLVEGLDRLPDTFAERHLGLVSGDLNVAAGQLAASTVLPEYIREFRRRHPEVRTNIRIGNGRHRLRSLRDYEADVAFAAVYVTPPDLVFRPVFSSDYVFIAPEDHPLAGRESVDFADIAAYPAVLHPASHFTRQAGDIVAKQHDQVVSSALEVEGWNVIKLYVEAGVGVSAVPAICLDERDRLWSIPASRYFPARTYGLLTRRDGILSLAAERFIRVVEESPPPGRSL